VGLDDLVGLISRDRTIAPLTTYRMGGPARWYAEVSDDGEMKVLSRAYRETPCDVLVLGRGSNVVVGERGFPGLVVRLVGGYEDLSIDGTVVEAGGAVHLPHLARTTAEAGLGGLEFFVGIPGSVGGAVRQNAGGHGGETAQVLNEVDVVDLGVGDLETRGVVELELAYRHSDLADTEIVLRARFKTHRQEPAVGKRRIADIVRWRREHQPGGTFNAGSVFKNPPDDAAGRIIDSCGLKGFSIGGVSVSEKHANFFVAERHARPSDLLKLVGAVREKVLQATGVALEPEVRFVGEFDEGH